MQRIEKKDWVGKWEEPDGYWIEIEIKKEKVEISRSGNLDSSLAFHEFSDDLRILTYDEKGNGINFEHKLTLQSDGTIEASWFDKDLNQLWKTETLIKSNKAVQDIETVDQGSASSVNFDEERFDLLSSEFIARLLPEIRNVLTEELGNMSQEDICELAEKIGFAVGSTIDGCDVIGDKVTPVPHLGFRENGVVVTSQSGSSIHEYTSGFFIDVLANEE